MSLDLQTAMLSAYPEPKVMVSCDTCGLSVRYGGGSSRGLHKRTAIPTSDGCSYSPRLHASYGDVPSVSAVANRSRSYELEKSSKGHRS